MRYEKELLITPKEMDQVNKLLHNVPANASECMGEAETRIYTACFQNGMSADVKVCGVRFEEESDNLPWTEAVLYNGSCEISRTDPGEEIEGEWTLYDGEDEYVVNVKAGLKRSA